MALVLQPRGPDGSAAQWHAFWTVNVASALGARLDPRGLGSRVRASLQTVRAELVPPPPGHLNPEVVVTPIAGLRAVVTVEAWFRVPGAVDTEALNQMVSTAIRQSGGGEDFPEHEVGAAMARCESVESRLSVLGSALGGIFGFAASNAASVATVCAEYNSYSGDAVARGMTSAVQRALAGPVADSNNTARVGERPPPVVPPDSLSTTHKVLIGVGATLVALAIVGYAIRSVRGAVG